MATAVRIDGLSKRFILHHDRPRSFQEMAVQIFRPGNGRHEEFWALRDVSLEVAAGETLGIIGANGSGKSTLLRLLARILQPTTGRIEVRGRLSSLIELGAGFHPDLTGQENVFLHGSILGLSTSEMKKRLPDIVAFSGLERFIDTPLKHFSSGMQARLGYAIASHVEPDVLVVDEALAVGDEAFQQQCFQHLEGFRSQGGTVVFVSHDLGAVRRLSTRVALLWEGRLAAWGDPEATVQEYHRRLEAAMAPAGDAVETGTAPQSSIASSNDPPSATVPRGPVSQ